MKLYGNSAVYLYVMKHRKKLRITQDDFLLANRRASRAEEIEKFGRQVIFRTITQRSKKTYDRNRLKRAYIKSDEGSFDFSELQCVVNFSQLLLPQTDISSRNARIRVVQHLG